MLAAPMKKGLIFDIRRYAIHDGPGIRTTVFFKGCPMRCWWCHNPEGQDSEPELVFRKSRCVGCGICAEKCQRKAILPAVQSVSIDRRNCVLCEMCSCACPSDALSIAGRHMKVEEVLEEIERDESFYEESGGGVTFSGGEPLMQPKFLESLLTECKRRDIHTTLDTCGFADPRIIDRIRDKVDLFLYDIKIMNDGKHRKYTSVSNQQILRNLKTLAENGSRIVISFPIVPGINDDDKNVDETAKFISSLPSIQQVNLLLYHRAGIEKYKSLGKHYKLNRIQPPSDRKIRSVKNRIEALGIRVGIGGG
jgi:pyruvate formate lyase activating enzyme